MPLSRFLAVALLISSGLITLVLVRGQTTITVPAANNVKTFPTDCQSLAYDEIGTGRPIILLGGGPGMNPAYMTPVAQMLAVNRRRVILLHQRGTGKSQIGCADRLTLEGAIGDLENLRTHLELQKLTIAGHSWGGMLAMAYAQEHPDKVAGLLLLDSGPVDQAGFAKEGEVMRARFSAADQAALKSSATNDEEKEKIMRRAEFADPAKAPLIDQSVPSGESLWYLEVVKSMRQRFTGKWDVTAGMKGLTAPVYAIFGREDPGVFIADQIQQLQPKAKVTIIDQAGHYPWLDNPDKTAAALKTAAQELP